MEIKISMKPLFYIICGLFLIQLSLALVAIFVPADGMIINFIYRRSAFDSERSISAFFSFGLLLLCSLLLALIAVQQRGSQRSWHWYWMGLAGLFLLMAYDEASSLHEGLIKPLRDQLGVGGLLYLAWVIPGLALAILIGLIYLPFLIHLPSIFRILFVLSGAIYITGALGMEMIGGRYVEQHFAGATEAQLRANYDYQIITTIEESMEIIGAIIFIYALMRFLNAQTTVLTVYLEM